jgi:AAA+ ATPase superfamily predicted ATPase
MEWGFYGRGQELSQIEQILNRKRWFFLKVEGRRRIGKTRLIQKALELQSHIPSFYVQIPDGDPAGIVSTFQEQMEVFGLDPLKFSKPNSLSAVSRVITSLVKSGYLVVLDEFQYFNRPKLKEFCSHLQREVDLMSNQSGIKGGVAVLGSIHTEMVSLLEDRSAPLYNRTTDVIHVPHWDFSSLIELLNQFEAYDPYHLLFLWNIFEGVPKFYRDCFEQGVLSNKDRKSLLRKMFFESSSPLKFEAENWFLKELHGRYDTILKYIGKHSGCSNSDLEDYLRSVSADSKDQGGGHLRILQEKYRLIEKKQPILSRPKERKGRYYISDNFLRSWIGALAAPVISVSFSPLEPLLQKADDSLKSLEGYALEKLVASAYEERSRQGKGDFHLTEFVRGYWDRSDTEIDLVAIDRSSQKIRFGTCKRSENELTQSFESLQNHAQRFLNIHRSYKSWHIEYCAISPQISLHTRNSLQKNGCIAEDFGDLFR